MAKSCAAPANAGRVRKHALKRARLALRPEACRAVLARLEAARRVPEDLRQVLADLRGLTAGRGRVVESDELRSVLMHLRAGLLEAEARVCGGEEEREARAAEQAEAEDRVTKAKEAIAGKKASLRSLPKAIDAKAKDVAGAKASLARAEAEVKKLEGRAKQLEVAAADTYGPLKEAPAVGREGAQRVKALCKVGKAFGFHSELLGVAPAVLKKQLDRRQTFDRVVLRQLSAEFSKQLGVLGDSGKAGEAAVEEGAAAVRAAQEALQEVRAARKRGARELAGLEAELAAAREAALAARHRVRGLPADLRRASRDLARARADLERLQKGQQDAPQAEAEPTQPAALPADSVEPRADALEMAVDEAAEGDASGTDCAP